MERKEDIILECFIVKGLGVDFMGVVFKGKGRGLTGLTRQMFSGNLVFLEYFGEENQQGLSKRLMKTAQGLANRYGLHPVHLEYPGGIEERRFIHELREAKREKERRQKGLNN